MLTVEIIGYLGRDAEIKTFGDAKYISFSVAHTEKVKGEDVTTWVSCLKYGESKLVDYLKKGTQVYARGGLYLQEKDGRAFLNCRVERVELLGKRDKNDDLPF